MVQEQTGRSELLIEFAEILIVACPFSSPTANRWHDQLSSWLQLR